MSPLICFDPGDRGLDFLLVVILGVALASSAAWLVARRLAGNAALRHLVLLAALICCLAFPALASFCAAMGLTLVSLPILRAEPGTTAAETRPIETDPRGMPPRPSTDPPPVVAASPLPNTSTSPHRNITIDPGQFDPAASEIPPIPTQSPSDVPPMGSPAGTLESLRGIATGAMFIWAAGALLMSARLAWRCRRVVRLRRSSRPAACERLQALRHEIAARLKMRQAPLLLVSRRTIIPLAVGFGRPAIILPECLLGAMSDPELRDVLIHEAAHLMRGDQRIVLLQELAGALYWPIVSVHVLNRELQRAREELCDNVVLAGRDAIRYGETLLHIAELLVNARPMRAALGIVGSRGELERRVAGLIDPKRNTMTTTGRRASYSVAFLFIALGALLSATRFAASAAPASDKPPPPAKPPASTTGQLDKAPRAADSNRAIILHGKVFGPGNRPIAGARLYLTVDEWTDPVELGTSDANGSYRFTVPEKKLRRTVIGGSRYADCQASLIATAKDLGPGWEALPSVKGNRYGEMQPEYAHNFLLAADAPIAGRVVDARGKAVARAIVAVDRIHSLSDGRWHRMHAAIKAGDTNLMTREQTDVNGWFSPLYPTAWNMIPPATTDAEGRFKIAGLGSDRAIRLGVTGPGVRPTNVSVLTRDDVAGFTQAIRSKWPRSRRPKGYFWPPWQDLPDGGQSVSLFGPFPAIAPEGDQGVLLFGPSLTIEVDPARTIAGVVRDASTGEPIAGLRIKTNDRLGGGDATTDRNGRYRLLRVEKQSSISVYNWPEPERYLTVVRRLDHAQGLGEINVDFDIPRGVLITGRVLEAGTNRPIVSAPRQNCHDTIPGPLQTGNVMYFPLAANVALRGAPTGLYFEDIEPYKRNLSVSVSIDPDGGFRMAVPPGPGVLFVQSSPGMPMFGNVMAWKESDGMHSLFPYTTLTTRAKDDGAPPGDPQSLPGFNGPIPIEHYHAYRVINVPADARTLELTLAVPRAPSRMLRFVDPDGRPIRGVSVKGLVAPPASMTVVLDGAEVEALAFSPGESREVIAISRDGKYIVKTSVRGDDTRPATIRLEPAGSISGRIIDENGKPLQALLSPDQQSKTAPDVGWIPQVRSDAQGRFRMAGLLPGLRYSAEIRGGESDTVRVRTAFENIILRAGEVRDVGDIRVRPSADAKSGQKPGK